MSTLLSISVAMLAGLLMTRLMKPLKLPDVTAYLIAGIFQIVQTELVADGKGNEAKGNLGNQRKAADGVHGSEAEPVNVQRTQTVGAN